MPYNITKVTKKEPKTKPVYVYGSGSPNFPIYPTPGNTLEERKRTAAIMSTIGGIASIFGPVGKIASAPLSIPDFLYDVKDAYDNYKNKKANIKDVGHLVLDIPNYIPHVVFDDVANALGVVDDLFYGVTGKPVEWHAKRELKRSLENGGKRYR